MINLYDNYRQHILKSGQALQGVFPTVDSPGTQFIYTIGNHGVGKPEMIIVGNFDHRQIMGVLNIIGAKLRAGQIELTDHGEVDIGGKFPLLARKASEECKKTHTIQIGQYYKTEDYEVYQLLLCDPEGRFPRNGCDKPFDVEFV